MKILFVSAEVAPFVSVGGLSQVMYFLPNALTKRGHDVRIFTPKHGAMDRYIQNKNKWALQMQMEGLSVPAFYEKDMGKHKQSTPHTVVCNIKIYNPKKKSPIVYFVENREYYELRANVFEYSDDHIRFALLSKACLEWLVQQKDEKNAWWPDIIQCNDWHTGYFIELAKRDIRYKKAFVKTPVVLTVHNFSYQGNYDFRYTKDAEKDTGVLPLAPLFSPELQKQNALLRGIQNADAINTVSPTHALEVLTPEYGEGLEKELTLLRGKMIGILNGLDTKEFNPETDPIIKQQYNEKNFLKQRRVNKEELQTLFSLEKDPRKPIIGITGRLAIQKGWDIMFEALPKLLDHRSDVQLIILGNGQHNYREKVQQLYERYTGRIGIHLFSDFRLPRKIFSGADMLLIPSNFEPGGIVALEALRYGSVPIVRRTGGLNDIVQDFDPQSGKGNGFSFIEKDPWALYGTIIEALTIYNQPSLWKKLVSNCLRENFSWDYSAKEYEKWYAQVMEEKKRAVSMTPHPAYDVDAIKSI